MEAEPLSYGDSQISNTGSVGFQRSIPEEMGCGIEIDVVVSWTKTN